MRNHAKIYWHVLYLHIFMFSSHRLEIIYYYPEIGVRHAWEMEISSVCLSQTVQSWKHVIIVVWLFSLMASLTVWLHNNDGMKFCNEAWVVLKFKTFWVVQKAKHLLKQMQYFCPSWLKDNCLWVIKLIKCD